jgi:hypothetical protein
MKQQAIQYLALDVHQATTVVSVRDEQGKVVMRATVATGRTPRFSNPLQRNERIGSFRVVLRSMCSTRRQSVRSVHRKVPPPVTH